jgi:peptidoglycan hydrolase CwlO-like protein
MNQKNHNRRTFKYSRLNAAAHRAMDWLGSVPSLIVHTIFFAGAFSLVLFGYPFNDILLVVTTIVSLEAIYMAIFIQMAVNQNSQSLDAVEEDIDEIQKDVDEIQEDVDEIEKDVDEIQKDVDEIEKDLDVIQEDVDGIEKDIDEIQKDVDEIEKDGPEDEKRDTQNKETLDKIESRLVSLLSQLEKMKDGMK